MSSKQAAHQKASGPRGGTTVEFTATAIGTPTNRRESRAKKRGAKRLGMTGVLGARRETIYAPLTTEEVREALRGEAEDQQDDFDPISK